MRPRNTWARRISPSACSSTRTPKTSRRSKRRSGRRSKKSNQTWPLKELEDGGYSITPKRKEEQGAPTVLDQKKHNIPADAGKPYAGCYVNCSIDVFCYTKNGGGVTSYLNGVQFAKDGEPLGAGATAASCRDEFDELEAPEAPQSDDDLM